MRIHLSTTNPAIRPGLSADWFGTLPMAGILLGFSVAEQDWGLVAVGAVATAFRIWLMSRRLAMLTRDEMPPGSPSTWV